MGVDEPAGAARLGGSPAPASHLAGDLIEVAKGGVALGVHDGVHVLGPADHPQLGDALVRRDHELHPRATRQSRGARRYREGGRPLDRRGLHRTPLTPRLPGQATPPPTRPRRAGSRPARCSTRAPFPDSRRHARAPLTGGTPPTRLPSSASTPRLRHHPPHGSPASGNRRVAIVFFLVCGYTRYVGDVKRLFGVG